MGRASGSGWRGLASGAKQKARAGSARTVVFGVPRWFTRPASSLNDTEENRRACLVNLATRQVGPAPTPLHSPLPLPRPVGMILNDARPWPIAVTTNLVFLWRDFGSQPKWNGVGQSLLQKLRRA